MREGGRQGRGREDKSPPLPHPQNGLHGPGGMQVETARLCRLGPQTGEYHLLTERMGE